MSFFISDALAETAVTTAPGGGLMSFLPLILLFGIFYFMLIRPQMKRAKDHKSMVSALGQDDEVVTSGGLLGRITELGDDFVNLEISPGIHVKVQRQAVATILPRGTIKAL